MAHLELDVTTTLAPDAAWRAWSSDLGLAAWCWPQCPDTDYRFNPETEKHYRIASESAGLGVGGDFTKVVKPTRLEFTCRWESTTSVGDPEPITVTLTPQGGGTRCVVTHECADATVDEVRRGWRTSLARFAALT